MIEQEKRDWDEIAEAFLADEEYAGQGYLKSLPPLQRRRLMVGLQALGDVTGKEVLVCGCGKGVETIQLLLRGAHVTTFDLSHGMCRLSQLRIHRTVPDGTLTPIQSSFEEMPFKAGSLDLAFGVDILHHLEDVPAGSLELR